MYRLAKVFIVPVLLAAAATAQDGKKLDQLISGLAGADETARIEARQMLPRYGAAAVSRVTPLVLSDDANVWWAAMRVLEDIASAVSVPGREAERAETAAHLMKLVGPEQSAAVKERGLRLLPRIIPEGYDLSPVAALLGGDPVLREKARAALQEIGTTEAAAALCAAVSTAEPAFQAALLDAIGQLRRPDTLPVLLAALDSPDPLVRVAAARAMAWTGDPQYLPKLRAVYAAADPVTQWDAGDALICHAQAMGRKGGLWRETIAAFTEYLGLFSGPVLRSGAISGLGQFGDETVVPRILAVLAEEKARDLEPAALAAFDALSGVGEELALLNAFPSLSKEMQTSMLGIFGRKQNAIFLPLLTDQSKNPDPDIKNAALEALLESHLPGAVDALIADLQAAAQENRAPAVERLKRAAEIFRLAGDKTAAGQAYLGVYRAADSDELRLFALEGIKQFPVPEAFDVIMESVGSEEFGALPAGTLAGIAKALMDAERTDEANKVMEVLLPKVNSTQAVQEAIQYLGSLGDLGYRLGFVNTWALAGPFPWHAADGFAKTNIGEPNVDRNATYAVGDKSVQWITHETQNPQGIIDLMTILGAGDSLTAYAYAEVALPEATDAVVRCGSDDGIKVWVNGQAVHENNIDRGTTMDQDQAPAHLQAGVNAILVQVTQIAGGWNFCLRLTKPDGSPLAFELVK